MNQINQKSPVVLGAVSYASKVVDIWEGFKIFFGKEGFPFDYVLYSNYERLVEALLKEEVDVAWNSPLAWIRAERMAEARGKEAIALAMRDTDCNLTSVILSMKSKGFVTLKDLAGKTIATGAIDSPQATLIPLEILKENGLLEGTNIKVVYNNILCGKHGDHVGGEEEAFKMLIDGTVDAACMIKGNFDAFMDAMKVPYDSITILKETPSYDHCNFTAIKGHRTSDLHEFTRILLGMSYDDPEMKPLLDMEGLKKWREGRVSQYEILDAAVNSFTFYDSRGEITRKDYAY
jgi:phosphonate transport system substrate-binding protein